MKTEDYLNLKESLVESGYGEEIEDISDLLENPKTDLHSFINEYIWVVINSGMKNQIAQKIFTKVVDALNTKVDISTVFKHKGKTDAIKYVVQKQVYFHQQFLIADDKPAYLKTLPWIGDITKYHLARNLGVDVTKPDRHLVRIAQYYQTTPEILCKTLSQRTGDRVGVVDVVLWRAANLKLI